MVSFKQHWEKAHLVPFNGKWRFPELISEFSNDHKAEKLHLNVETNINMSASRKYSCKNLLFFFCLATLAR